MRYATFSVGSDTTPRLGLVQGDRVIDAAGLAAATWPGVFPRTVLELVQLGPDVWARAKALAERASGGTSYAAGEVRWHAPIPRPAKNIFCLGLNYASHARESAQARGRETKIPTDPVMFSKAPTTVTGPYDDIRVNRAVTDQVDWEAELGVIIGTGGTNIRRADALGHVFGYTIINDTTARDLQQKHFQWFKGKSLNTFCPMGPLADPPARLEDLTVVTRVNGQERQRGNARDMVFAIPELLAYISGVMTLDPGDLVITGSPAGVGTLSAGDEVEVEVLGVSRVRNPVTADA
jgi:2-keto-4-pentenoate hydratase/2-oxohepta-3-ene-1,7-dioic acid hydratase in catechol pathway